MITLKLRALLPGSGVTGGELLERRDGRLIRTGLGLSVKGGTVRRGTAGLGTAIGPLDGARCDVTSMAPRKARATALVTFASGKTWQREVTGDRAVALMQADAARFNAAVASGTGRGW